MSLLEEFVEEPARRGGRLVSVSKLISTEEG